MNVQKVRTHLIRIQDSLRIIHAEISNPNKVKAPARNLKVKFPSGKIIYEKHSRKTALNTIVHLGVDRCFHTHKVSIIYDSRPDDYGSQYYIRVSSYYVKISDKGTEAFAKYLRTLASKLDVTIAVETPLKSEWKSKSQNKKSG